MVEEDLQLKFRKSITLSEKVGCGHIYAIIELKGGAFDRLTIRGAMAKSCDCGESFLQAIGKILTFGMRRAIKEGNGTLDIALIKHLQGHRCNKPLYRGSLSCVDGIARVIKKYMEVVNGKKETDKN